MPAIIPAYDWQLQIFDALQNDEYEHIAALGSRGPGKTWTAQHVNIARALMYPDTNHIIFRRTSDDIVKQYAPDMAKALQSYGGCEIGFKYNATYKVFNVACPNGGYSRIFLGFAESVKHAEKAQGFQYMTASFDEVTHFEEAIPALIGVSVRGHRLTKKLYFGNPGGIGHSWVKRKFIDPATRMPKTLVLQPRLADNIVLARDDPGYADRITADLPDWKKQQWLNGDWDISEGQYFSVPQGTFRKIEPPPYAKWWAGVDWGYHPSAFACVWVATWIDRYGHPHAHVYLDLKAHKLSDTEQAETALQTEKRLPPHFRIIRFADPSTGKKLPTDSDEQSRSTAQTWARNGFVTMPAKRFARIPGWTVLREMLRPVYDGGGDLPYGVLTIDPDCMALITELVEAQYEQTGGVIIGDDLGGEDHNLDALRYLLTMVFGMTFSAPTIHNSYPQGLITSASFNSPPQ